MDRLKKHLLIFLLATFLTIGTGQLPPEDMERIDDFVEGILECAGIPGMTLAAVKDGQEVIAKGYGKASLEQGIDVDENTLFNIGSASKAFTATLAAILLNRTDDFNWNTPVRDIIGNWFHLYNGYYSNHTTLRDLLAMKTGVPRNDVIWLLDTFDRDEQVERARFLNPVEPFRTNFLYNNIMYMVAGKAAEVMGSATWEELVTELLFEPIGMSSSTFIDLAPPDYEGFATPYIRLSENDSLDIVPNEFYSGFRSAGPAGSIASNAKDMAKWIAFWLNAATTDDGTQILTPKELSDLLSPEFSLSSQTLTKPNFPVLFGLYEKYAKGWFTGFYRDYLILQHGGDMTGYHSTVHLLPDLNIGSFLSVNHAEYGIRDFILTFVNDILIGEDTWITVDEVCSLLPQLKDQYDSTDNPDRFILYSKDKLAQVLIQANPGKLEVAVEEYVGSYGNFGYGNVTVNLDPDTQVLEMVMGNLGFFDLEPTVEEDVFIPIGNRSPADLFFLGPVIFGRSEDEVVETLAIPSIETSSPPVFIRGLNLEDAPPPDISSCN